jgi:hypothetical protein
MKREHREETILHESGIEVIATYEYTEDSPQIEECHGFHNVGGGFCVDLERLEIIIAGKSIDIYSLLNDEQKNAIIDQLSVF